jgi:hypothetical protein
MKRLMSVVVMVLVLGLVGTVAVNAESMEGTGSIRAWGAGIATVAGDASVNVRGLGVGTISVRGAETLKAAGRGFRWDLPDDLVLFMGWSGYVHAAGENIRVTMVGGLIEFGASGTGTVFLKGRGHYWTGDGNGEWTVEGVTIDMLPTE